VILAPTGRALVAAAASGRLAYGLATMFAPRFVAGRFAAHESGSVMNLRGFGGLAWRGSQADAVIFRRKPLQCAA